MNEQERIQELTDSNDMTPVAGTVVVDIPVEELWSCFTKANLWARWNKCFFSALNKDLVLGKQLIWVFEPIRWYFFYKFPAIAKIVEVEERKKVTWEVAALPGFYARHTYHMEDLGGGRSRFGSWEKAYGITFRLFKWFWIPHFVFVKDRSLAGAKTLETIYKEKKKLDETTLPRRSYLLFWMAMLAMLAMLGFGAWFYTSFVKQSTEELAPQTHAVLGGGGNSLILQDGDQTLLVDPKFPPGSKQLRRKVLKMAGPPTAVVNTHYHYDHTQGNPLYPDVAVYAHRNAPDLMRKRDGDWWAKHQEAVPDQLVDQATTLQIGKHKVVLNHAGPGHTTGDLWVHLPDQNVVALGDLMFHTYFPFFDSGEGGTNIPQMAATLRTIAGQHPDAVFLPGHGPLAKASDVLHYADFLDYIYGETAKAFKEGKSEAQASAGLDLSKWSPGILPSMHNGKMEWATTRQNVARIYEILRRDK